MLVVIDTNLLNDDYLFRNAQLKVILAERRLGHEVAISEATLFEHAKHYVNERRDAAKLMRKLDGDADAFREIGHEQAKNLLRERAEKAGLKILPLPDTAHAAVLDRAHRGIRPFEQEGHKGYSDTLIWESVKVVAATQDVVLLSNDGDFGKDDLDTQLRAEARSLPHGITLMKGYKPFIEGHINPQRALLVQLQKELANGVATDKRKRLEREVVTALTSLRLSGSKAGMSSHYSQVDFGTPTSPLDFATIEVRPLGDKQLHLRLVFTVDAPVSAEYWFHDDPEDLDSVERDWDVFDARLLVEAEAISSEDLTRFESVTVTGVAEAEPAERDEHGE